MKLVGSVLIAVVLVSFRGAALAEPTPIGFEGARWIWSSGGTPQTLGSLPADVNYFRAEFTLPTDTGVRSADVIATADNLFVLHVNGKSVGESEANNSAWQHPKRFDVTKLLVPGRNVVAVEAVNTLPGPAGLIVKVLAELTDGRQVACVSDGRWKCYYEEEEPLWQQPEFDDRHWHKAQVVGEFGARPWGKVAVKSPRQPAGTPAGKVRAAARQAMENAVRLNRVQTVVEKAPPEDYCWPEALVFLDNDCSLYRPLQRTGTCLDSLNVTIFNPRKSRAFPEHDLPAPMKVGRTLQLLKPARPGVKPRLLLDAGNGGIGSPSVSFDGRSILVSMAYDGEPFFHIYRVPAEGGTPERLTKGPFHDIDPAELPDGRIVFTSTRIGFFEEYHNPPARALFVMNADGTGIRPITYTIIFDNEPEVLADGRILFIRSDNFFDRGKVETLLHAIHPDGTEGYTEFGLDNGPEYGGRLRAYYCGSPAPMADGRVAFLSRPGITIGQLGHPDERLKHFAVEAGDIAAMPDGRLLCTVSRHIPVEIQAGKETRTVQDVRYEKIAVFDPNAERPTLTALYESPETALHSPVFLGARPRPPVLPQKVDQRDAEDINATGFLSCQNAKFTQNTTAGWSHVRAIRVLAGKGLTTRSSHSYIVHAGNETVELGTVPLAPDGSFYVEVPADTPLAFQAVDAEGRSELNEMSWIYVRPGERRVCAGCHHPRQVAPTSSDALAQQTPPLRLLGQGQPHRFRGNNAAVTGLMELQFDRYREVAGINRHSASTASTATGAQEVAEFAAQLRSGNEYLMISAAQRLSVFRDPAAAPALAERLCDDNREVAVAAAVALATCGTRESVSPLMAALTDREPLVAQAAAMALENLTGHTEPFNAFVSRSERRRQATVWRQWFENTTWKQIEQELIQRIRGSDRDVVRRAAVALGHTGSEAARPVLRAYLTRERDVNPLPDWRKAGHRGDRSRFNSLSEVNPRTLQAVTRAIGSLKDSEAVPLLAETLDRHSDPATGNLFLAEAAVEALGRIGTPDAIAAIVNAFAGLKDYPEHTSWYGDHGALMACHASPVHYFLVESLDTLGTKQTKGIVPDLIRSVPIDPDRALLLGNDDCEALTGRVIRRNGAEAAVVETCLSLLGDANATRTEEIETAISTVHRCWAGHPGPENRAAQILSLVCRDRKYEPRIRAAFERYRAKPTDIPRVFDTGIPVVDALPVKHWVCFYLARTLGNLADVQSVPTLISVLKSDSAEAASGHPDPLGPGVHFLHNDLTPCWRAAAAWALGRIGDRRAVPALLEVISNMSNATDTRHAAAEALCHIGTLDQENVKKLRRYAREYPETSTRRALQRAILACEQKPKQLAVSGRDSGR